MDQHRRHLLAAAAGLPLWVSHAARAAEAWPARPVTVVSPYNAGGTNDLVARTIGDRLHKPLGQTFVVDNRGGAAGVVGSQSVMRAKADGYTLLSGNNGCLIVQVVMKQTPPYDPLQQFTPIAKLADAVTFVGVSPELKINSVGELIELARRKPGQLNYSSAGVGSFGQFVTEYFKLRAGLEIEHVPCNGSAAALTELMSGRVHLLIDPVVATRHNDPRIQVLAVVAKQRFAGMPAVPTTAESGGPEMEFPGWFGWFGPPGLPPEVVQRVESAARDALAEPEVRKGFLAGGLLPAWQPGSELRNIIAADLKRYAEIRTRAKIQLE